MLNPNCLCWCNSKTFNLEKLDKDTGEIIWRKAIPGKFPANNGAFVAQLQPLANGNFVAMCSGLGLSVLDPNGKVLVTTHNTLFPGSTFTWFDYNFIYTPDQIPHLCTDGNFIYSSTPNRLNTQRGAIIKFDADLNVIWEIEDVQGYPMEAAMLAVYGGVLWVINNSGYLISTLNLADGTVANGYANIPAGSVSTIPYNQFNWTQDYMSFMCSLGIVTQGGGTYQTTPVTATVAAPFQGQTTITYFPSAGDVGNVNFGGNHTLGVEGNDFIWLWSAGTYNIRKFPVSNGQVTGANVWIDTTGTAVQSPYGKLGSLTGAGSPTVTKITRTADGNILVSGQYGAQYDPNPPHHGLYDNANVWLFDGDSGELLWWHSQRDELLVAANTGSPPLWNPPYKLGHVEVSDGYIFGSQMHNTPQPWKSVTNWTTTAENKFTLS